jgi:hypothetical protein
MWRPTGEAARPAGVDQAQARSGDPGRGRGHRPRCDGRRAARNLAVPHGLHRCSTRARHGAVPRPRHDVPTPRVGVRRPCDGPRRLRAEGHRHLARRSGRPRPCIQRDVAAAERGRPPPPRTRRQRFTRAEDASRCSPRPTRKHHRRSRAGGLRRDRRCTQADRAAHRPRRSVARPLQARVGCGAARAKRDPSRCTPGPGCGGVERAGELPRRPNRARTRLPRARAPRRRRSHASGTREPRRECDPPLTRSRPGPAQRSREGSTTRLEVADEGPGIPADDLERVFERFYRSDPARSADVGGAGLGLAIARWIVELHGGTIRAATADPTGCRIVVELPR